MNCAIINKLFPEQDTLTKANVEYISELLPGFPPIEIINLLSTQTYEKKECKSKILFIPSESCDTYKLLTKYVSRVLLDENNMRQITKFLASTTDEHALVMQFCDNEYYTVGVADSTDSHTNFQYDVRFHGHMKYSLHLNNECIFRYENGKYIIPAQNQFEDLENVMVAFGIDKKNIDIFKSHIEQLLSAKHGTTFVFCSDNCSDFYKSEVERLCKAGRGVRINSLNLFDDNSNVDTFLKQTSVADGGFLVDLQGNCEFINTIFDGEINSAWKNFKGRPERGSRYNSLYTYVYSKNFRCASCAAQKPSCDESNNRVFAIVLSDDGFINVIFEKEEQENP